MKPPAAAAVVLTLLLAPRATAAAPPVVRATLDHATVRLGDRFRYTVEARARGTAELRIVADTAPFALVGAPSTWRGRLDDAAVVRLVQILTCVDRACAPLVGPRRTVLPSARATDGAASASAPAVALTVIPRVPASAVAAPRAQYRRESRVAGASTPMPLGAAVAFLAVLAAVSALAAAILAALVVRPRRNVAARTARDAGLSRAVRLLRESVGRPPPDRRRAADYLARVIADRGKQPLVADASRVAWSPPEPGPSEVEVLASRAERTIEADE